MRGLKQKAALLGLALALALGGASSARAIEPGGMSPPPPVVSRQPRELGVRVVSTHRGVLVRDVAHGSPAARAGLEPGDLIVRVDGFEVGLVRGLEFPLQSELRRAGPVVMLEVIDSRSRRPMTLEVRLEESGLGLIAQPAP
jgi:S1-C subfamily serine protease